MRVRSLLAVVLLLAVACADGSEPLEQAAPSESSSGMTPVLVSSELVVGENRVVLGLLDENDAPTADPSIDVVIAPVDPEGNAGGAIRAKFAWSLKPVVGVYITNMTFPSPGRYDAVIQMTGEGFEERAQLTLEVVEKGTTPLLGGAAPSVETLTASRETDIEAISTDPDPDPRFYQYSIIEALDRREPFVIVFSTPKFCTSQVCGPTLETVKQVSQEFKDVNFIHIEPYELPPDLNDLQLVPAAEKWGLPSEPYVFAVDARGRIAAKYEGVVTAEELTEKLSELTRP